uniref:ATP synthase F0 subunit 8 n=1 Tax=Bombus kashmirensis TaxID=395536 RepID=A0A482JIR7_9HYME|nr:ATP synthase F0 subunit 8 [Bombus kashmirensis]
MMPINWLMIFLMCLTCLIIIMILMNSLMINYKLKNNSYKIKNNKMIEWKWLW